MGRPLAAFSMMALLYHIMLVRGQKWTREGDGIYRSMTVMTGQVSAPAVIALAMSTPRRMPSLSVFHFDEAVAVAEAVGAADGFNGRSAAGPGMVTGPSGVRAFRGIIC
jgi:hypothetical protein